MRLDHLANRTVITGSADDLTEFADIVSRARSFPAYGGALDAGKIREGGLKFAESPLSYAVPDDMDRKWIDLEMLRACWFRRAPDAVAAPVLYLHGGGFVGGSVEASRGIAACLAAHLAAPVLALEYRQGPEHPYPAAVEDTCRAYDWLTSFTGLPVTLIGDSAGGALAVGMALEAARTGRPKARCAIAMSAWMDFALDSYSWQVNRDKDLVTTGLGQWFIDCYLAATPHVQATSFYYDQLTDAPPLLFQMGSIEGPLDGVVAYVERARAEGVQVELEVYTGMPHNFAKFKSPISDTMFQRMADWSARHA
jgi:epsilon-lactone hydrolase